MGYLVEKMSNNEYRLRMIQSRVNEGYMINNKITEALKPGQWMGNRCFIIGGGESIKTMKFDFNRLNSERVIGINRAYEFYSNIDILYMMDVRYVNLISERKMDSYSGDGAFRKFKEFKGIKVVLNPMSAKKFPSDIYVVRKALDKNVSLDLNRGLLGGSNSGFGAIQLAMALGANPIYLLGYDMSVGEGTHWHNGYPKQDKHALAERLKGYRKELEMYAPKFKELGFDIVNLSPNSELNCFRFENVDAILGRRTNGKSQGV